MLALGNGVPVPYFRDQLLFDLWMREHAALVGHAVDLAMRSQQAQQHRGTAMAAPHYKYRRSLYPETETSLPEILPGSLKESFISE